MEEENLCASLPDVTDSVFQQPREDSWTSIDHQYINGEQESVVWGDAEVQVHQAHGTNQLNLSPKAGRETPEEAEEWEKIIWPVHPMTCSSASLSFATVQWDMPDPSAETCSLMTDSRLANEPDSGGVMSQETTSPSLHRSQNVNAVLFIQGGRGEEDEFESRLLISNLEWTGNVSKPCDAADVQEPPTQEQEGSPHELLDSNNEIRTEEEEGHSATSDPVEAVDLISEDEADSFVDLKLEEEQEELDVLLTGQGDSEEEQTSANGVENEEEGEGEEEEQINVSCPEESEEGKAVSCLSDVELPAEPLQADDTGPTINTDKLIDLPQSELLEERRQSRIEEDVETVERLHEDPTGQTEEPEMCKDVDQNLDPEQPEPADDNEEASIQAADNTEEIEKSPVQETSCLYQRDCVQTTSEDVKPSPRPEGAESEQVERTEESEQIQADVSQDSDQLGRLQHLEPEMTEESTQPETAELPEDSTQSEPTVCVEAEDPGDAKQQEQTEPPEQNEQTPQTADSSQPTLSEQLVQPETDESEITEQLSPEAEVTQQTAEAEFNQVDKQAETSHQGEEEEGGAEDGSVQTVEANGEKPEAPETAAAPHMNGDEVNREMARRLAQRLFKLDDVQRVDVVKHLDKDNDFSRAVGEEYLKLFDFTGQTLDHALRSFLKVVVLIGETQERERVLQHFACRFQQCNPDSFTSSESALALTCALMLLNTDLHGQNVGKCMSSSKFVSNLDGMSEGENFSKDLLKSLYNSIKSEPLEWAIDEEELKSSVLTDDDAGVDAPLRSKANPFQDVPHDETASVAKQGFLQRKLHADIDGKRTPWGKRSWKTFYGVLKGMVLYLQKDDYGRDQPTNEEVVSVHHSLVEQAADYTKKPHVFRLQTADWRVFLFQASSKLEMFSWISRINLVSALHSSPPFPAAVGSQRRFFRPVLPSSLSAHTLERQLQSYAGMLESFKADLSYLQQNLPERKKAKARELEEHRVRAEYLHHEMCRYEIYIQGLEAWKSVKKTGTGVLSIADLKMFDKAVCADSVGEEEEEECMLKKSHSSPSLDLEMALPTVIKVRRNISERRTYRRTIIPRWNKES
ncbi:PH and SEC7 domain-containing protein 4 [Cottoperca gobio]|uniref:PH and SEC7 domain-containing protein 4-like n=1 Tax=Cottoperca gobio TaxID=56716 RepID=A0A6J2QNT4_COTGO|nr:PH and SEC7 domain-containing protein 4-like [Cottoperca gobio]XP_029300064.1 PH and SEC7 domain-containing protein 4-like [Cottoperca gobio]XP_029300065.1 PH and SEC7 domain-containing protein 4-like [Cottoperca gobio]XP_029300066.1 PH and SEC7 domain-containing protein 4-like [Cottoperca gobio]XP_029300067.1 PH and SEC7 domain-containing protein 4-like [Cottoperca gobio]